MAKIKIKTKNKTPQQKSKLLEILASHNIFATAIFEARDGYSVTLLKTDEQDTIFSPPCQEALNSNGFQSVTPLELKAKRTVLLFNCPDEIMRHKEAEIKEEIYRVNDFTINNIEEIYKFKGKPIVKIIFNQASIARKTQESGVRMYNMSIPPHQIEEEEHIPVTSCMRCYALDSHFTSQCPRDKDYIVCSECAEQGHKWYQCPNANKTCINCNEAHSTLAYKCAARKQIVNKKKEENKAKKEQTYSAVTAQNIHKNTNNTQQNPTNPVSNETTEKIMTCILLAHVYNIDVPDSYEMALNTYLTANNYPQVKVPLVPNSRAIMNLTPSNMPVHNINPPATNPQEQTQEHPAPSTPTQTQQESTHSTQTTPSTQTSSPKPQSETEETITEMEQEEEEENQTETESEEIEEEIDVEDNEEEDEDEDECQNEEPETGNEPEDKDEDKRSETTDTTHSSPTNSNNSQDSSTHTTPTTTSHTPKISQDSSTHSTPTNTSHTSHAQEIKTTPLSKNTPPLQQRLRKSNKEKWRK